jgi:hypothetical protein
MNTADLGKFGVLIKPASAARRSFAWIYRNGLFYGINLLREQDGYACLTRNAGAKREKIVSQHVAVSQPQKTQSA